MFGLNERILPLLCLLAAAIVNAVSNDHPFSIEPSVQPYYVRENESGPILNCAFSENYRNRDRYEPEWTRVVDGMPKRLARDSIVFLKNDYSLHEDSQTGEYNLQIKTVKFEKDNGQFFCSLLDRESGEQLLSTPATVMVVENPSVDVISDPLSYDMFRTELHHKYKTQQASVNSRPGSPADLAATKIQAAFRGHVVRKHPEKFGIDAVPFDRRRSHDRLNSMDNKKDLKRHSVGGYSLETTMTSPEDRAATKIQAEIRGFLTRKKMGNIKKENNDAATKIQAHIRGYLTRKHLEEEGLLSPSRSRNSLLSNRSDENLDQTATAAVN